MIKIKCTEINDFIPQLLFIKKKNYKSGVL